MRCSRGANVGQLGFVVRARVVDVVVWLMVSVDFVKREQWRWNRTDES